MAHWVLYFIFVDLCIDCRDNLDNDQRCSLSKSESDDLCEFDEDERRNLCSDALSTVFKDVNTNELRNYRVPKAHIFNDKGVFKYSSGPKRIKAISCPFSLPLYVYEAKSWQKSLHCKVLLQVSRLFFRLRACEGSKRW